MVNIKSYKEDVVNWIKVEKSGIVDIDQLYVKIWEWFQRSGFMAHEKIETVKVLPQGNEIKIEWGGYRKVDDYVNFWINAEIWSLRTVDVFVKIQGEKVKKQKADFEIRFKSWYEKDYNHHFKRLGKFGDFIRQIYEKYFIKERLMMYEDKLRKETFELQNIAKMILDAIVT